jgi:hypothetical protein
LEIILEIDEDEDEDYYTQPTRSIEPKFFYTTTEMPNVVVTTIPGLYEDTTVKIFTQTSPTQKQVAAIINPDPKKPVRLVQTQNGKTITYPPTYETKSDMKFKSSDDKKEKSPNSIESISNPHEDITISKTTQKIKYKTRYLPSKSSASNSVDAVKPNSFVSVTKSESGSVDDKENGKVSSTYFTKSSTCGQFTFTCNIVYGAEGRSRICRPKQNNPKC